MKKKNMLIMLCISIITPFSSLLSSVEGLTLATTNNTDVAAAKKTNTPGKMVAQKAFLNFVSELYKDLDDNFEMLTTKLEKLPKTVQLKTLQESYVNIIGNLQNSIHKLQHKHPKFTQKLQDKIRSVLSNLKIEFKKIIEAEEARKEGQANWEDIVKDLKEKVDNNLKDNFHRFIDTIKPHIKNITTVTTPAIEKAGKAIETAVSKLKSTFSKIKDQK